MDYAKVWAALPEELRVRAVGILRRELDDSFFAEVRNLHDDNPDGWVAPYHHFAGMTVRNTLRKGSAFFDPGIPDADLPPARAVDPDGCPEGNWDDYYVQALEEAAGVGR